MFDFTDQVAIVTGASGNLGRVTARALYEAGAKLVLVDTNLERLETAFGDVAEAGKGLLSVVDLTDAGAVDAMAHQVVQEYGRIDILINIAGGFSMGPLLHETPLETWEFMLNLNAKTVFLTARAVVPHMLTRGSGKIVSIAARAGLEGKAKMGPYIVSKSAVIRLTESLADELKEHNINVNCILPGTIDTPQNRASMPNTDPNRWVQPQDLANAILFLSSDLAKAIHGAALPVYGRS